MQFTPALLQFMGLLIQLAMQAAPSIEAEGAIIIRAIEGTAPTDAEVQQIEAATLKLQAQADTDADTASAGS